MLREALSQISEESASIPNFELEGYQRDIAANLFGSARDLWAGFACGGPLFKEALARWAKSSKNGNTFESLLSNATPFNSSVEEGVWKVVLFMLVGLLPSRGLAHFEGGRHSHSFSSILASHRNWELAVDGADTIRFSFDVSAPAGDERRTLRKASALLRYFVWLSRRCEEHRIPLSLRLVFDPTLRGGLPELVVLHVSIQAAVVDSLKSSSAPSFSNFFYRRASTGRHKSESAILDYARSVLTQSHEPVGSVRRVITVPRLDSPVQCPPNYQRYGVTAEEVKEASAKDLSDAMKLVEGWMDTFASEMTPAAAAYLWVEEICKVVLTLATHAYVRPTIPFRAPPKRRAGPTTDAPPPLPPGTSAEPFGGETV
jgi:hypothetical protein